MPIYINSNDKQYEVFETFNVILKDNDIVTLESKKHKFKILLKFINDESGKSRFKYTFSEEHNCPFLYFINWTSQKSALKEVYTLAQVTTKEFLEDSDVEIETEGTLGLQVFVYRSAEVINATLQFLFKANQETEVRD